MPDQTKNLATAKTPGNHSSKRFGKYFRQQSRDINTLMQNQILFKFNTDKPEDQKALLGLLHYFMNSKFLTKRTVTTKIGRTFVTTKAPLNEQLVVLLVLAGLIKYKHKSP